MEHEEADAGLDRDHLRRDEQQQRRARAELESGEDHGQRGRQDDLADHAPPPGAEGHGGAQEQRVGLRARRS